MNRRGFLTGLASAAFSPRAWGGEVHRLHCVLRPAPSGRWFVQDDETHSPHGIDTFVTQTSSYLRIFTCCGVPADSKAGSIQISTDNDFGDVVTGRADLGRNNATIYVRVRGELIDPADIYKHLPEVTPGNGNFWIDVSLTSGD